MYHSALSSWYPPVLRPVAPKPAAVSRSHRKERPMTCLCYITATLVVVNQTTCRYPGQTHAEFHIFQTGIRRVVSWEGRTWVCLWLRPWPMVGSVTEWKEEWNPGNVVGTPCLPHSLFPVHELLSAGALQSIIPQGMPTLKIIQICHTWSSLGKHS